MRVEVARRRGARAVPATSTRARSRRSTRRSRGPRPTLFGICVVGVDGRTSSPPGTRTSPFTIMSVVQAVRVRARLRCARGRARRGRRSASTRRACPSTRVDADRASERRAHEPDGEPGRDRDRRASPRARAPRSAGSSSLDGLSRFAGRDAVARRGGLRVRVGDEPAATGCIARAARRATAGSAAIPPRRSTSTRASARSRVTAQRPRGDGRDARRRRRQPAARASAWSTRQTCRAHARGDDDRRPVRDLGRLALRRRAARQERDRRRHRHGLAREGRRSARSRRRSTRPATASRVSSRRGSSRARSGSTCSHPRPADEPRAHSTAAARRLLMRLRRLAARRSPSRLLALVRAPAALADLADEQALAEKHAPVVRLVEQRGGVRPRRAVRADRRRRCSSTSRPSRCAARGTATDLVKIAPDGRPTSSNRFEYHLDFPGDALDPGCDYERWARRITEGKHADGLRARRDRAGLPGQARAPVLVLLRLQRLQQHARGRLGDDPARLRRGRRRARRSTRSPSRSATARTRAPSAPTGATTSSRSSTGRTRSSIPAAGSHANKFTAALYLGSSAEAGVGCDDTRGPHRELRPRREDDPERPGGRDGGVPVDRLRGPLGRAPAGVLQRPDRPEPEDQWTRADRLVGGLARPELRGARPAACSARARPTSSAPASRRARRALDPAPPQPGRRR